MQLDRETGTGIIVRSFADGKIHVNDQIIDRHVILTADEIIVDWRPPAIENLGIADFSLALDRNPEVIIFGSGVTQRFPDTKLVTQIMREGIGFETMDTAAACRTFNVLASERRRVVAALLVD